MIDLPLRVRLHHWLHRVVDWYTDPPKSLDEVEEVATIGDHIGRTAIGSRLPDGWCVDREMVRFKGESLAEVVQLTSRGDGYRITLKPVEMRTPTGRIEIYTRPSPFKSRQHRQTVDSLSAAVAVATEIAAGRDTQH